MFYVFLVVDDELNNECGSFLGGEYWFLMVLEKFFFFYLNRGERFEEMFVV